MVLPLDIRLRHVVGALASVAVVVAVASSPHLLGDRVGEALEGVSAARPAWLWVAAAAFVASLAATGCAWRSAILAVGGRTSRCDAAARYGVGSLVNTFAPGHLGSAARIALYARTLEGDGRVWAVGGIATVVSVARFVGVGVLVALGAAWGVLPWWPLALIAGAAGASLAVVAVARRRRPSRRVGHLLDAFRALGSDPRAALRLLGWVALLLAGRVGAAAAVCTALGLDRPLLLALLIVPAVDVASFLPLTPGNVGIVTAAVAFALGAYGVDADLALAAGIAFHAVDTLASVAFGAGGALALAHVPTGVRRWAAPALAGLAAIAIGGAFGATVVAPLV